MKLCIYPTHHLHGKERYLGTLNIFSDAVDSARKERVYLSNSLQNDNRLYVIELTSILGTDFTIKINVKKQR